MCSDPSDTDGSQHLTLYVLRRNFMTWLGGKTNLNEQQQHYLMGHEIATVKGDDGVRREAVRQRGGEFCKISGKKAKNGQNPLDKTEMCGIIRADMHIRHRK